MVFRSTENEIRNCPAPSTCSPRGAMDQRVGLLIQRLWVRVPPGMEFFLLTNIPNGSFRLILASLAKYILTLFFRLIFISLGGFECMSRAISSGTVPKPEKKYRILSQLYVSDPFGFDASIDKALQ